MSSSSNSSRNSDRSDRSKKSLSTMSDCSFTSEKSVTIELDDTVQIDVQEAGVQTSFDLHDKGLSTEDEADNLPYEDYIEPPRVHWQDKLNQAMEYKLQGNEKYNAKEYRLAIGKYHRALIFVKGINDVMQGLPSMPESEECDLNTRIPKSILMDVKQLELDCYNNLSAALLRLPSPMYKRALDYCNMVLHEDPGNVKALFRKGVAYFHLNQYDEALAILEKAQQCPGIFEEKIDKYVRASRAAVSSQERKAKKTYQAMFYSLTLEDEEDVFTEDSHHPNLVTPKRKEEKASSVA